METKATNITFKILPPDDHNFNLSNKVIKKCKYHFIVVMSETVAYFSVHLWCKAIPQSERQLLLLRQSNMKPKASEYAYVYGTHN